MAENNGRFSGVRAVIFDLDGTLIDSQLDLVLSVNAMLEHMGREPHVHEKICSFIGNGAPTLVRRALGDDASDADVEKGLAYFLEYYRAHMLDNTDVYPGVREALVQLQKYPMAVLTNKPVRFSRAIIQGLNLSRYFRHVYGGNSFATQKARPGGRTNSAEGAAGRATAGHDGGRFRRGHQDRAQHRNARVRRNLRFWRGKFARAPAGHNARHAERSTRAFKINSESRRCKLRLRLRVGFLVPLPSPLQPLFK